MKNLYEITGHITDINTLLVNRGEYESLVAKLAELERENDDLRAELEVANQLNQMRMRNTAAEAEIAALKAKLAELEAHKANCKFPVCHSQEYQDKLVQEILAPELAKGTQIVRTPVEVTREMVSAAHGVTLERGDIVLSANLLERIYRAMRAKERP